MLFKNVIGLIEAIDVDHDHKETIQEEAQGVYVVPVVPEVVSSILLYLLVLDSDEETYENCADDCEDPHNDSLVEDFIFVKVIIEVI